MDWTERNGIELSENGLNWMKLECKYVKLDGIKSNWKNWVKFECNIVKLDGISQIGWNWLKWIELREMG